MAKDNKPKGSNKNEEAAAGPSQCKFDGCKKNQDKFGFCLQHYDFYMAGVIRGDGTKPVDYEQKLSLFQWRNQKKAA